MVILGVNVVRWSVAVALVFMVGEGSGQGPARTPDCTSNPSVSHPGKMDVTCDCLQKYKPSGLPIGRLTLDQRGCPERGLILTWAQLEGQVAPTVFTIQGSLVDFNTSPAPTWTPSITHLYFVNCSLASIPGDAFKGMTLLKELKFVDCKMGHVEKEAVSNHQSLTTVEIANSTVGKIHKHAFVGLPNLEDFAIIRSSVISVESEAVSLVGPTPAASQSCPKGTPSLTLESIVMRDLMGRQLEFTDNLSLPQFGSRLLLFDNKITTIKSAAFTTNSFGFLILGGNNIVSLEEKAFVMELFNECEISAALLVGNGFGYVKDGALAGIEAAQAQPGARHASFLAMFNNTFIQVAPRGMELADNLHVFTVDANRFKCGNCSAMEWVLQPVKTETHSGLIRDLVTKGSCTHNGGHLARFLSSCKDGDTTRFPTFSPAPTPPITTPSITPSIVTSAGCVPSTAALVALVSLWLCHEVITA